jgi:formate dehydrogenase accessory protein FdhD
MTTPLDLEDFAVGFSLTEGVIHEPEDIRGIRVEPEENGLRLAIELKPNTLHEHLARKRAMSGRTGCGVCGIDDLKALPQARVWNDLRCSIGRADLSRNSIVQITKFALVNRSLTAQSLAGRSYLP